MEITQFTIDLVNIGLLAGYLLAIVGVLLLFFPKGLLRINNLANRVLVRLDENSFKYRVPSGIISVLLGLTILFILYKYL